MEVNPSKLEPIVSLFSAHMIGELTKFTGLTGLDTLTKPSPVVGAETDGLGSLSASGSALWCAGSSCGCLIS